MKMTVPETKTAMLALYLAIEWENSLVDAHRIGLRFNKKTGHVDKVVRGMSINMNHDMFYIDDSAFDDLED